MSTSVSKPIVVGINGSKPALGAAFWAADEAVNRNVPLRLVHVVDAHDHDEDTVVAQAGQVACQAARPFFCSTTTT